MSDAERPSAPREFQCNECFIVLEWAKIVEHTDKTAHTFKKIEKEKQEGV